MQDLTIAALLDELRARGARISIASGQFFVDAPAEVLTPDREALLGAHRVAVLALLRRDPEVLLAELWGLGATVSLDGDDLDLDGPSAALSVERLEAIRAIKPELVAYLRRLTPARVAPNNIADAPAVVHVTGMSGPTPDIERVTRADGLAAVARAIESGAPFALTLATTGPDALRDQPRHLQVALSKDKVFVVDLATTGGLGPVVTALAGKMPTVFDGQRDLPFLAHHDGVQVHGAWDVATAGALLRGGRRVDRDNARAFRTLTRSRLGIDLPGVDRTVGFGAVPAAQIVGLAREAAALVPLREALECDLKANRLSGIQTLESCLAPVLATMHLTGVGIDRDALSAVMDERRARLGLLSGKVTAALGTDRLSNDGAVLAAVRRLGLDVEGTSKEDLGPYRQSHPAIGALLEWRSLSSFVNTAGPGLLDALVGSPDGRIRPQVDPLGAISGRFSYSRPNLQGLDRADPVRRVIVPAPGNVFVCADYSQIDLRILAAWTHDPLLLKVFADGGDVHALTASVLTGKPEADVTADERKAAKAVNFGIVNKMSAKGLATYARAAYGIAMTEAEAHQFLDRFLRTYTGVAKWHRKVDEERPAMLATMAGRRRHFGPEARATERVSAPIQGSGADGLKLAMIYLHRRLPSIGGRLVLTVHDEVLGEVPQDRAAEGDALVDRAMVDGMTTVVKPYEPVRIVVEADIRMTWAKGSKIDAGGAR